MRGWATKKHQIAVEIAVKQLFYQQTIIHKTACRGM